MVDIAAPRPCKGGGKETYCPRPAHRKSQKKGAVYVTSEGSVLPAPPVRGPLIRPRSSVTVEPESPGGGEDASSAAYGDVGGVAVPCD